MSRWWIATFVCSALAAAASPAQAVSARYTCADGTVLTATFSRPDAASGSARLAFTKPAAPAIALPQVLSADGGRYANAEAEFWIKGRGATLTRAGRATTCRTR